MGNQDILIHTYNNPRVGGSWWPFLQLNLSLHGFRTHDVSVPAPQSELPRAFAAKPGLIFLYWRWPMDPSQYPDRQAAYERQLDILDYAMENKVPTIIYDGDLQPGAEEAVDLLRYSDCQAILAAPMLFPKKGYTQLFYPMIYLLPSFKYEKLYDFCYVGNNYGRYDQMKEILNRPFFSESKNYIFGNWLIPSPNRQSIEQIKADFPYVTFGTPVEPEMVRPALASARFTYHFARPDYNECGFVAMRWQEAASAGCLGLMTEDFVAPDNFRNVFGLRPEAAYESDTNYRSMVTSQFRIIELMSSFQRWLALVRGVLRGI